MAADVTRNLPVQSPEQDLPHVQRHRIRTMLADTGETWMRLGWLGVGSPFPGYELPLRREPWILGAVQSVRFLNGIKNFVHVINNPTQLKVAVETLGFGHLNIEVTIPRVMIFRDALIDLLEGDLGDDFGPAAREGWMTLLSYIGGALIYVRTNYAERL
ncbi:unnamed protein product, partial [Polarella glacialis]